jgi:hypothetical protein
VRDGRRAESDQQQRQRREEKAPPADRPHGPNTTRPLESVPLNAALSSRSRRC